MKIYGDGELTDKDISIDHFVPWSYVANDEIWNLHPTTRSINSAKSNNLSRAEFGGRLSEIVLPVYQSAKSAEFREWLYEGNATKYDRLQQGEDAL